VRLNDASKRLDGLTTGKYSGAACHHRVDGCLLERDPRRAGMTPISTCSSITLAAASIASTRSGVGGTTGRPSVAVLEERLLDVRLTRV
jgi:hypothetical protein